jgi:hypothetical protein
MLKRGVDFLIRLWKRDPALNSKKTLAAPAGAQRAALGMRNAAPGSHEVHRPRGNLERIALAVAVHDAAVKKIGDGRKPDVGMRANIHASASDELHRPHLIKEDERTHHLASGVRQRAVHGKTVAQIAHARNNDQVEHIAAPFIAEYRVLCRHPAHCILPSSRLRRKVSSLLTLLDERPVA